MKNSWKLSFLLASVAVMAQSVIQRSVQHFESLDSGPFLPFITFGFGTPEQNITGIFDTGSSDTIIPEAGSGVCKLKTQQCTAPAPVVRGQFDSKAASDFKRLDGQPFNATFAGGDQYDGDYIETTITLGDNGDGQVPNAQVALATNSKPQSGLPQVPVFGQGPQLLEATDNKYDNLPKKMKDAGVTKSQAYSFVANSIPLANGSVFFGGIDRSKFEGELQEVPLEKDNSGEVSAFVVKMSSVTLVLGARGKANGTRQQQRERERMKRTPWNRAIKPAGASKAKGLYAGARSESVTKRTTVAWDGESQAATGAEVSSMSSKSQKGNNGGRQCKCKENGGNGGSNGGSNGGNKGSNNRNEIDLGLDPRDGFTLMDTGGVAIALPPTILSRMAEALGTTFFQDGLGPVDCDRLSGDGALVMRFNDDAVETRVPLANMRISEALADPALTSQGLCELGVRPVEDGDTSVATLPFFAAVYTVFDLDNNRLFLAQAKGDPSAPGGQLEEFPNNSGGEETDNFI